ncbi:MAG: MGMT family protein [Gemmatimonadales bacterium]
MISATYQRIYRVVSKVPRGRVVTYGQVAKLAGIPGRARQVGYAMHALPPGSRVPWQRVVNAKGMVSRRRRPGAEVTQRILLEAEGVRFDGRGRIVLARFQWTPVVRGARARSTFSTGKTSNNYRPRGVAGRESGRKRTKA